MPKTTHVANAYHEDIYVKLDADIAYVKIRDYSASISGKIKGVDVKGSLGMKTEYDWRYAERNKFTRIPPREVIGPNPDASDRGKVYITILTKSGIVVCEAFPRDADYSVIVDKNATIKCTEYGKWWVDEHGVRH